MADRFYALEKLTDAVDALATGAGRVQERLGHAAIHLVRVRPEDIPDENLRRVFAGVMDDLSYAQAQGDDEGNIRATMRLTDDEDARAIARRIVGARHDRYPLTFARFRSFRRSQLREGKSVAKGERGHGQPTYRRK
jgi:hypothetical protein